MVKTAEQEPIENTRLTKKVIFMKQKIILICVVVCTLVFFMLYYLNIYFKPTEKPQTISQTTEQQQPRSQIKEQQKTTSQKTDTTEFTEVSELENSFYTIGKMLSEKKEYIKNKNCDETDNTTTHIAFLKSSKVGGETSLWISDEKGCNHEKVYEKNNVCGIYGWAPGGNHLLVALCERASDEVIKARSGFHMKNVRLGVFDLLSKQMKELATIFDLGSLYDPTKASNSDFFDAGWLDESNIWYFYYDPNKFLEEIIDIYESDIGEFMSTIRNSTTSPDLGYFIEEQYFKKLNKPFMYRVNIDGTKEVLLYPSYRLFYHSPNFSVIKQDYYKLPIPFVVIPKDEVIEVFRPADGSLAHLFDVNVDYSEGVVDTNINSIGTFFKKYNLYKGKSKEDILIASLSESERYSIFPDSSCTIGNLDEKVVYKNVKVFNPHTMVLKEFSTSEPLFINISGPPLYDFERVGPWKWGSSSCQNAMIVDVSEEELKLVNFLCEEEEYCYQATIK